MTPKFKNGLVQVYTGSGKGKTTAALGLALRAIGHDFKVCFIQLMKGSSYSGELFSVQRLKPYIDFYQFGRGCPYSSMIRSGYMECQGCGECFYSEDKKEEFKEYAEQAFELARKVLTGDEYQLVVLDEISIALKYELLTVSRVLNLIAEKSSGIELVLTGRDMPVEIRNKANLVSEIKAEKHPYKNEGIASRRGIEY